MSSFLAHVALSAGTQARTRRPLRLLTTVCTPVSRGSKGGSLRGGPVLNEGRGPDGMISGLDPTPHIPVVAVRGFVGLRDGRSPTRPRCHPGPCGVPTNCRCLPTVNGATTCELGPAPDLSPSLFAPSPAPRTNRKCPLAQSGDLKAVPEDCKPTPGLGQQRTLRNVNRLRGRGGRFRLCTSASGSQRRLGRWLCSRATSLWRRRVPGDSR